MTFEQHLEKLRSKEKYSFSRWGDGEWLCLLNYKGANCDGHEYFNDLGNKLRQILTLTPKYTIGLQSLASRRFEKEIESYTNNFNLTWCGSDVFHHASSNGKLNELFEVLKDREVILVGANHLKGFKGWKHIEIPTKNCWLSYDKTLIELEETIKEDDVVLFCASMMSNVLIDELNGRATLIDMGSVFDPYAGVNSRTYHKTLKI